MSQTLTDWPLKMNAVLRADDRQRRDFRQIGRDVLADPVAEIFLLRIAGHVLERKHADRRLDRASRAFGTAGRLGGPASAAMLAASLSQPGAFAEPSQSLRLAHWIWLNGIGGMVPSSVDLDQRSKLRARHPLRPAPIATLPRRRTTAPPPPWRRSDAPG